MNSSSVSSGGNRIIEPKRSQQTFNPQSSASWYQPGNNKCSYPGCNFSGPHKALEIHKMDRHLIYPPRWEKRKQKSDWDADPSLKGKAIPIQGTTLVLDSLEAVDAWIAERKKRWPTTRRIEEKKLKMDEAIARGQLSPEDSSSHRRKRRKLTGSSVQRIDHKRDNREDRALRSIPNARRGPGWHGHKTSPETHRPIPTPKSTTIPSRSSSEAEPDDDKPEVISSKQEPPSVPEPLPHNYKLNANPSGAAGDSPQIQKPYIHQPRRDPPNPFASRPVLLRNLLLPEIRVTISNLSQAIRFLEDNDFLRNVEMKAGEAQDDMIQVINASGAMAS